jgi:hypothetical protein
MVALTYLDHEKLACSLLANYSFVRPRRRHSSVPTAVQFGCRVERRSRMAATWRPPEGLVLDGREHGGRLNGGGRKTVPTAASEGRLSTSGHEIPTDGGKRKPELPSKSAKTALSKSEITLTASPHRGTRRSPTVTHHHVVCLGRRFTPLPDLGGRCQPVSGASHVAPLSALLDQNTD